MEQAPVKPMCRKSPPPQIQNSPPVKPAPPSINTASAQAKEVNQARSDFSASMPPIAALRMLFSQSEFQIEWPTNHTITRHLLGFHRCEGSTLLVASQEASTRGTSTVQMLCPSTGTAGTCASPPDIKACVRSSNQRLWRCGDWQCWLHREIGLVA